MHIPDGFLNGATSAGTAVVAAGGLGLSVRRAGAYLQDSRIALTGLVAAFVFALQMLNFPVVAGTSGHLLGGALAVILVGPWLGITAVGVVVIIQALLFADGGITALGSNVLNMAIVTGAVGWSLFRVMTRLLPKSWVSVLVSTFTAALVSVAASSVAFVIEYGVGGRGNAELGTVLTAMVGIHFLIGIGEGLISATIVAAVGASRPELIAGLEGTGIGAQEAKPIRAGIWGFAVSGVVVAALLVLAVAPLASSEPDGLERVATDQGIIESAEEHALAESPLADYGVEGVEDEATGTRVAGMVGVLVTFGIGAAIVGDPGRRDGGGAGHLRDRCGHSRRLRHVEKEKGDHRLSGTAHAHTLYRHGSTPVHRLPAQVKVVALLVFVVAVVAIPRQAFWAHALAGSLLLGVIILAELPAGFVLRRMIVEVPILIFALLLPFFGRGETTDVLGLTLSIEGLWGAWTILAKATLGVGASIVVSATSTVPDLIRGMGRLRVPRVITAIAGFMVRYLDIVAGEFSRRRVAMASRGYEPRWLWQTGPLAQSAGSLFIRSFERGERVHQAMVARGFNGRIPAYGDEKVTARQWLIGLTVPGAAVVLTLLALTVL